MIRFLVWAKKTFTIKNLCFFLADAIENDHIRALLTGMAILFTVIAIIALIAFLIKFPVLFIVVIVLGISYILGMMVLS